MGRSNNTAPFRGVNRAVNGALGHWITALDKADEDKNDRDDQEDMDEPAYGIRRDQAECPKDKKDDRYSRKHMQKVTN